MRDITAQLESYQEHLDELYAPISVDELSGLDLQSSSPSPLFGPTRRTRVLVFAAAFAVTLLLGVLGLLLLTTTGEELPVGTSPPTVSVTTEATTESASTVLTTAASPAPTCPPGSNPDAVGPADQDRPRGAPWSNQAAVFDDHAGRIIFVDGGGWTWMFDVCTNTWEKADEWLGESLLVYDVDSHRTIAFGSWTVKDYKATDDTWTERMPSQVDGRLAMGAVYEPQSGLVLVLTDNSELVSYDVDTDTWTAIGEVGENDYLPYLVGLADTGRVALLRPTTDHPPRASGRLDDEGLVIDPLTGEWQGLAAPGEGVFAGFGRLGYATGTSTAVVETDSSDICRLDPTTLEWTCVSLAEGPDSDGRGLLAAIVGDPINDRVVLIYGYGHGFGGADYHDVNDIWAIDFDTGEWTQLLQQTGDVTFTPGAGP